MGGAYLYIFSIFLMLSVQFRINRVDNRDTGDLIATLA